MSMPPGLPPRPWFYYVANPLLRTLLRMLTRVDIHGFENVPPKGGLVVAISHSSFLDPVLLAAFTPRKDVVPMAKVEAFDYPILGALLRWYGAFAVRRGEADMAAFKMALRVLNGGAVVVIAPEGHRSETGALQKGREGAIMLSLRTGAPILPVAVWGGKAFWSSLSRLRRAPLHCRIGKPVLPVVTGAKPTREGMGKMSDELMVKIAELMPPELHGYYTGALAHPIHHLELYRAPMGKEATG
ncbi:MAG: 1-acyl-sn-glycerol-3-phosphate acyltransferase [Chloroflexi bacterium]|nr:1-acyl-sn-glycerol-3-phosphate acyltransferase [Chloroflexota bacterium]